MSFAPWLRFPHDEAMQYRLRYAPDPEFNLKERVRTSIKKRNCGESAELQAFLGYSNAT
jgi:hypothetical protein